MFNTVAILEFNMAGTDIQNNDLTGFLHPENWQLTGGSAFLSALISKLYATR